MDELSLFFAHVLSACGLLFPVIDPLGNVFPIEGFLRKVPAGHIKRMVILREILIAGAILLFFLFFGSSALNFLQIEQEALRVTGGILLFLIAMPMIFPKPRGEDEAGSNPFIVPIAIPFIAGPSSMTVVILMQSSYSMLEIIVSLFIILFISLILLWFGSTVVRFLGDKGSQAVERLMGLVLIAIAIQMFLSGVSKYILELNGKIERQHTQEELHMFDAKNSPDDLAHACSVIEEALKDGRLKIVPTQPDTAIVNP